MGKRYRQVTIEEKCEIARLQAEGRSIRQIAVDLDRSASAVARELKRNGSKRVSKKGVGGAMHKRLLGNEVRPSNSRPFGFTQGDMERSG